jgi:hypothetical protein
MRKTNEEFFEEVERSLIGEAIRQTENEIFDEALDAVPDEDDWDHSLEDVEGWDGAALSLDEIAEGPNDNNFDRPLELRREQELEGEVGQLRQALAERDGQLDEVLNGTERQEALRSQVREQLYQQYGILGTDDRVDQLVNDIAQQHGRAEALHHDRVGRSLADAHAEFGEEFEQAYNSVTRMDRSNPAARALVADIWNAPDPGQRMMDLARGGVSGLSRGGTDMGALGLSGTRNQMGGRSGGCGGGRRDLASEDSFFGNRDIEEEIFNSAFE